MIKNPKYKIITYGCQMNKSDSERIEGLLESIGFSGAKDVKDADLILVNTCSVRQTAEDRVYGMMRDYARLKNKKPHLLIGITGCMAGRDKDGVIKKRITTTLNKYGLEGIDLFFGIADLPNIPEEISRLWKDKRFIQAHKKTDYLGITPNPVEWWRGWVVIQTGCSNYCTYCVVPHARGHEVNRPVTEILKEVKKMVASGAKEIILLGQAVNSHPDFAKILQEINKIDGVNRISFASAHPMNMTVGVIKALALSKMVNYLHLPVQSGNNKILQKMNRKYTRLNYLKVIERIRKVRPDIALATDIIVGFPGETKTQFKDTISLYKKCDFDMSYNARYSTRTGTVAHRIYVDDISREEKKRRWEELQKIMERNVARKNKKYLNKVVEVLVDGCKNKKCYGLSREYKRVVFPGDPSMIGDIYRVKVKKAKEWELDGLVVA